MVKFMKSIKKPLCVSVVMLMLSGNFAFANIKTNTNATISKDESVYVTINPTGKVKGQIVSDWIHVNGNNQSVKDVSQLKNIVNLKGDEVPEISGSTLNWKPIGNDLFYQGDSDKKLPIDVRIKYYLNNKETSPEVLLGKSGKITIKLDFVNNVYHMTKINGKSRKIYTMFTSAALVNLPMETFKNVKVSNGEVISDGNNQVVAFVAFPGLTESLKLDRDVIDIPEGTTITADAKVFKLGSIMIAATPKLPALKGFDEAKTIDELTNGINQLMDASKKLTDGAIKLSNGQRTFTTNFAALLAAMKKLSDGSKDLSSAAAKVDGGVKTLKNASEQVAQGTVKLSENALKLGEGAGNLGKGAVDISDNSAKLVGGAMKLADGAVQIAERTGELSVGMGKLADATEQLMAGQANITSGAAIALNGITELKAAKQKEIESLNAMINGFDTLKKLSTAIGLIPLASELSIKMNEGLDKQLAGLVSLRDAGDKFMVALNNLQSGIATIKAGSEKLYGGTINLQVGQKNAVDAATKLTAAGKELPAAKGLLADGSIKLSEGATKLKAGGESLSDGANQFVEGSKALVEGTTKLTNGLGTLSDATGRLSAGASQLFSGLGIAYNGGTKLFKGAEDILKGSIDLSNNLKKFNSDGIVKMSTKVLTTIGNIDELLAVKDEMVKQSKQYNNFSGIGANMNGTVKFIYKTDEIKAATKK